jgi:hypothetical protein
MSRKKWLTKSQPPRGFTVSALSAWTKSARASRLGALVVQDDMIRSSSSGFAGALRISLALAVLPVFGSGCGPEVEVLTDETGGEAGTSDSGARAGSGGGAGTGGTTGSGAGTGGAGAGSEAAGTAGAATVTGTSVCAAIDPSDITSLKTGEPCPDRDVCEPNACAGTASGNGSAAFAACRNHQVQLITMKLLDVPENSPLTALNNGVSWDDCDAAVADGVSGEACTWAGKSCIRPTNDTCCREGAECITFDADSELGLLRRIRVCAPDCEDLEPDTTLPVVTDCASAAQTDLCHATRACAGDFTCYGTAGDWVVTEYDEMSQLNGALWCAGGSLVGGYGLSWGP